LALNAIFSMSRNIGGPWAAAGLSIVDMLGRLPGKK